MQTFGAFLVSLLATSGFAAAFPAEGQKTATVDVTYNTNHVPHGARSLLKAYAKYNRPVSDKLRAAAAKSHSNSKRQTGSATNHPNSGGEDDEYITTVNFGTPAQALPMDFDTGSSDLWVFSSETPKSSTSGHTLYQPAKSSTAQKQSGSTWSIKYQDLSNSSGDVYTDNVSIGGFTVKGQAVESATKVSTQFVQDTVISGLVGLAFDSLNTVKPRKAKTWISNAANSLAQPVFTADLRHQANGSYNFGFIDTSVAKSAITYVPVDSSEGFWGFTVSGFSVGGARLSRQQFSGIADTGTTLLLLDDSIVDAYYENVQSAQQDDEAGGIVFDCDEDLPTFTFGVGSASITISSALMNLAPVPGERNTCFGGLQSNQGGDNIFGDVALKAALVVFDVGNERLGWAQK